MITCEQVQAQLLGYLYDLLDDSDKAAADAHLAGCERCQLALTGARRQQRLLATAAKTSFPNVQFERPHDLAATVVNRTPAKRTGPTVFHFALAASLFLALGLGVPAAWFGWKANDLKSSLSGDERRSPRLRACKPLWFKKPIPKPNRCR